MNAADGARLHGRHPSHSFLCSRSRSRAAPVRLGEPRISLVCNHRLKGLFGLEPGGEDPSAMQRGPARYQGTATGWLRHNGVLHQSSWRLSEYRTARDTLRRPLRSPCYVVQPTLSSADKGECRRREMTE